MPGDEAERWESRSCSVDELLAWPEDTPGVFEVKVEIAAIDKVLRSLLLTRATHVEATRRLMQDERTRRETRIAELKEERKAALNARERASISRELLKARRDLAKLMREGNEGRWRQFTLDEIRAIPPLTLDAAQDEFADAIEWVQRNAPALEAHARDIGGDLQAAVAAWSACVYEQLRRCAYYTQQVNRNFLPSGGSARRGSPAWQRTCNVTSFSMVLSSLGLTPTDYDSSRRGRLSEVFARLEDRATLDGLWDREVSTLRTPDFVQLASIELFVPPDAPSPLSPGVIDKARRCAASQVTNEAGVFALLAAPFGLTQFRVQPGKFDSLGSVGRDAIQLKARQEPRLRLLLAHSAKFILWEGQRPGAGLTPASARFLASLLRATGIRHDHIELRLGPKLKMGLGARPTDQAAFRDALSTLAPEEPQYVPWVLEDALRFAVGVDKPSVPAPAAAIAPLLDTARQNGLLGRVSAARPRARYARFRDQGHLSSIEQVWLDAILLFDVGAAVDSAIVQSAPGHGRLGVIEAAALEIIALIDEWNGLMRRFQATTGLEFREQVRATLQPLLDHGASVVVNRRGHYMAVVSLRDDAIVLNDPASGLASEGSLGAVSEVKWSLADKQAYFRAYHVFFHPDNPYARDQN